LAISYSVAQFFFNPVWGMASDRFGRRPILLVSLAGAIIFYTMLGWAPSLLWLFVARTGAGVFAANISTAMAAIADVTSAEERTRGMGLIGAAFGLGFVIGPAVGGFLSRYGYEWPGYGAAVLSFVAFCLALIKFPETRTADSGAGSSSLSGQLRSLKTVMAKREIARPIWVYFLVVFAFACLHVTFPLYTQEVFNFDVVQNGYLFAYVGLVAILFQGGLTGRLAKRFGEGRLAIWGTALSFLGLFLLPFAHGLGTLIVLMTCMGVGTGLNTPTLTSLVSLAAEGSQQGGVLGVSRSISTLGRIVGPLWGGWMYGAFGMDWTYWSAAILLLFSIWVGRTLWHVKPQVLPQ
jgi:DHA1 family tetracycline resistance protein-like MFS transporter